MSDKKSAIQREGLTENYASEELLCRRAVDVCRNRSVIIDIVRDLKSIVFPIFAGYQCYRISGVLCGTQIE